MSLKFKGFFKSTSPLAAVSALGVAATLCFTSGCAKLNFERPGRDEVRKIQEAGEDAPPPSGQAPAQISATLGTTPGTGTADGSPAPEETPAPIESAPPSETFEPAPSSPLSPSDAPSETSGAAAGTGSDDIAGTDEHESGEHSESGSEHASETGKEHSDEHSAHHRSHARVSHSYSRTFTARKLTDVEIERALTHLPYRSTREHPMETLQMSRATRGRTSPRPHVLNSQVLFAIDITDLPDANQLPQVNELRLSMEVTRVSIKDQKDTEILCLIEQARCSGRPIAARSWQANRNESFWSAPGTSEVIHSSTFADSEPGSQMPLGKTHRLSEGRVDINLTEALGADTLQAIRSISTDENGKRILLVSISDDTLVHSAELIISGTEKLEVEIEGQEQVER